MDPQAWAEAVLRGSGVALNGAAPWDIRVNDPRLFERVMRQGTLGFGEAYMDGWWDCETVDEMISRVLQHDVRAQLRPGFRLIGAAALALLTNRQTIRRSTRVGEEHYDLGNDLYEAMLDRRMTYSCAYWNGAQTLDEAQEKKLDLICRKLNLAPGQTLLDIGCGWGSLVKFAAERYGIKAVGLTISKEQARYAAESCRGLPIEILLQDYREIDERFDRIVSVGMFEHVGYKNYRTFFEVVRRNLRDEGFFLLHTIGGNRSSILTDAWIAKYIFPNSMLPSAKQISEASEGLFVMEDWQNLSTNYDKTLLAWYKNFESNWDVLKGKYSERFRRMWQFYLLASAGTFRARKNQVWQIVYTKNGLPGGYQAIR